MNRLPGSLQAALRADWMADTTFWPQTQTVGPAYAIKGQGPSADVPGYLNRPRGRSPHYVSFTGSFPTGSFSSAGGGIILDRYGNFYNTLGASYGWGPLPISFEVTHGVLSPGDVLSSVSNSNVSIPDEAGLKSFLTGESIAGEIGAMTAAGSISCASGRCMLEGAGGLTSVIEYSWYNFSWQSDNSKDEGLSWDWVDRTPGFGSSDIQFHDPPYNECMDECGQPGNIRYTPLGSCKD